MKALIAAAIGLVATSAVGAFGYGLLSMHDARADIRYVMNDSYKAGEVRKLQYQIDELEWTAQQRKLTPKEQWQLKALKRQVQEARGK